MAPFDEDAARAAISDLYNFIGKPVQNIEVLDAPLKDKAFSKYYDDEDEDTPKKPSYPAYVWARQAIQMPLARPISPAIKIARMIIDWKSTRLRGRVMREFNTIPLWPETIRNAASNERRRGHTQIMLPRVLDFREIAAMKFMIGVIGYGAVGEDIYTLFDKITTVSKFSPFWFERIQKGKTIVMYRRPKTIHIEDGRFHHPTGPAIELLDGIEAYCWKGTVVPADIITKKVTARLLERTPNMENRRVLIERIGFEKFLRITQAYPVHRDKYGTLYEVPIRFGSEVVQAAPSVWDSPLRAAQRFVKVKNSTPEPDGSFKHYVLQVPPNMNTAKEAVAWTFGLSEWQYNPEVET